MSYLCYSVLFFCFLETQQILTTLYTINTIIDNPAKIVNITSIQKYWYQASLCTGDRLMYCCGYFMICSSHHVALSRGCSNWSTAIAPSSAALFAYFGWPITDFIPSRRFVSDISWNGIVMPIPSLSASFALAGWSPWTGMKTCQREEIHYQCKSISETY